MKLPGKQKERILERKDRLSARKEVSVEVWGNIRFPLESVGRTPREREAWFRAHNFSPPKDRRNDVYSVNYRRALESLIMHGYAKSKILCPWYLQWEETTITVPRISTERGERATAVIYDEVGYINRDWADVWRPAPRTHTDDPTSVAQSERDIDPAVAQVAPVSDERPETGDRPQYLQTGPPGGSPFERFIRDQQQLEYAARRLRDFSMLHPSNRNLYETLARLQQEETIRVSLHSRSYADYLASTNDPRNPGRVGEASVDPGFRQLHRHDEGRD